VHDSEVTYSRSAEEALDRVSAFLADFSGLSGKELRAVSPASIKLPVEELFGLILANARQQHAVAPSVDVSQISRLFEIYRTNVQAARMYKPRLKWLPERTVLVRSVQSGEVSQLNEAFGWEAFATRPLILRDVEGTHYSMLRRPGVAALAGILREFM
jgi:hypothetical protein